MTSAGSSERRGVVVLISADAEWAPVKAALQPARIERSPYGEFFEHTIAGERVRFFHGGWGKIAAAASTEYAIARWQPLVLLNLGTCGGIDGRVPRGEKLLVERALAWDIGEAIGDAAEAIAAFTTNIDLRWLGERLPIPLRRAAIVSADRDLVPADVPGLIARHDAIAADWESAAIAYVAARHDTRLMIVRAVSDLVSVERGEAIAAPLLFQREAAAVMQSLLHDLETLIPYAVARARQTQTRALSDPPSREP